MTLPAGLLIIVSAFIHAGWNLLSKRTDPSLVFFFAANILGSLSLAPALFFTGQALTFFQPEIFAWLLLTGIFQAIYYLGLSGAYRSGDLSIAYPLARSLPVVFVALANLLLGRSEQLSPQALTGMVLVTLGGLLLPLRRLSDWHFRTYLSYSSFWALIAAVGVTGYSLVDDHALRMIRQAIAVIPAAMAANLPLMSPSATQVSITYSVLEGFSLTLWVGLIVLVRSQDRRELSLSLHNHWKQSALAGSAMAVGYTLVLIAMGFARNVSYIVAFRQTSILLGTLFSVWLLKEPAYPAKFIGVLAIFIGLVLVAVG